MKENKGIEEKYTSEACINLRNFGQISKGSISLKPLTIFIGANNSGKSYAAMLTHSIFESKYPTSNIINKSSRFQRFNPFQLNNRRYEKGMDQKKMAKLISDIKKLEDGQEIEISDELINEIIPEVIKEWFEKGLTNEFKNLFSSPLSDLNRIVEKRKNSFSINVKSEKINVNIKNLKSGLKASYEVRQKPKIIIKCTDKDSNAETPSESIKINIPKFIIEDMPRKLIESMIYTSCEVHFHSQFDRPCYYLPASRSGILQNHRPLIAGIMSNMSFHDVEDNLVSGIIIKFLSTIINLPSKKGEFFELVQGFEEELIQGNIAITNSDYTYSPNIRYRFKNTEIPLHRSSSTVSELAPIFLYLKYLVKPNSFLIIEEPEAHLHPKNIRILARLFVKLIRKNVHILITTHSDYLLEQLSTFIKLSDIDPEARKKKFNYDKEDYLLPNEVSGYVFKENDKLNGTEIVPIEIDNKVISQEEFIKIREVLYEEMVKVDDILDSWG